MFSSQAVRALLLSGAAGLSTLLGALVILFIRKRSEKLVTASLGFAGGVMLSVSFMDMLPEAIKMFDKTMDSKLGVILSVVFVIVGLLCAVALDLLVPHTHHDGDGEREHQNLFRVGMVSMAAIALHNLPEGVATFMAGYDNAKLGFTIAVAIAAHNIPEGITVAMPIYFASGDRKKAFRFAFLSGVTEPIGALLVFLLLQPFISSFVLGVVFAIVAGIMIYISIEELIPSSRQYGHARLALFSAFAGICLMPLTHVIG
ncbi:MAG: zinc transporter ZupT [Bacillota bacterium]